MCICRFGAIGCNIYAYGKSTYRKHLISRNKKAPYLGASSFRIKLSLHQHHVDAGHNEPDHQRDHKRNQGVHSSSSSRVCVRVLTAGLWINADPRPQVREVLSAILSNCSIPLPIITYPWLGELWFRGAIQPRCSRRVRNASYSERVNGFPGPARVACENDAPWTIRLATRRN